MTATHSPEPRIASSSFQPAIRLPRAPLGHPDNFGPWSPAPLTRMTPLDGLTASHRHSAFTIIVRRLAFLRC
ncbi:hypothetical protein X948_5675 [Burkholderia pseudomallei MSHR5608]|nr:hypothetical protein X948_5675 [Burkholderia pseudomallei MSHR5608]